MAKLDHALRWLTVPFEPHPEEQPFLDRAETQSAGDIDITVAVPSDRESKRFFGVRMARRGVQPVWIRIVNRSHETARLDIFSIDSAYYTPLEAAYVNHFSLGKRLLSFGLLAWLFLPIIPLVPFKLLSARATNRKMNAFFTAHGFRFGPIRPGDDKAGFVFSTLDEGTKDVQIKMVSEHGTRDLSFSIRVPGLSVGPDASEEEAGGPQKLESVDETTLRTWLERQPRCTSNRRGDREGDPLNLVVVGDRATILRCFGARWDEAETITISTCMKSTKAFLFNKEYRYMPVSPLYLDRQQQDLALQRTRATISERLHLRLWRTHLALKNDPVWIGQISRDIGVRFTTKTWNLSTHKIDPDVDEARDYIIDYLMAAGRASRIGYVGGVGEASPSAPRRNLTGDPYFTNGLRAVVILSASKTPTSFLSWS